MGRARELAELRAGLADTVAGRGQVYMLVGEPGIGKTRLADELAAAAGDCDARVLWGRCWEGEGAPAFWPWVQAIRSYVEDREVDALRSDLGAVAAVIAQIVPDVLSRLPGLAPAPPLEPPQARFRLFDSVSIFLRRAGGERPLVLILDDLHWADKPSLLLLEFLARDIRDGRLLLIGTYRDVEMGEGHPLSQALASLARESRRIALRGLFPEDVGRFIENASGSKPPPALVSAVYEKTEGNPFYVSEIVGMLEPRGGLQRPDGIGDLGASIPHGVKATIRHRLARLSPGTRQVLDVASVIGREFGLDVLSEVGEIRGDRLLDALEESVATRVIAELPRGFRLYRFSHALVRETLYEELTSAVRARLHRRTGEALEGIHRVDPEPYVAELAHHFFASALLGGDAERAVDYSRRAGDRAGALLAHEDAAPHYQRALDLLESRQCGDDLRSCELLLSLGEAQSRAADLAAARSAFSLAADLSTRLDRPALLARAALGFGGSEIGLQVGIFDEPQVELLERALSRLAEEDNALRARVMSRLATALYWSSSDDRKIALSQAAVAMARRLGDPATLAYTLNGHRWSLWGPDGLEGRLEAANEILRLADPAGDREMALAARAWRIVDLTEGGEMVQADTELEVYTRLATELRLPRYQWRAPMFRAMRALMDGRFGEVEGLAAQALRIGEDAQGSDAVQAFGSQMAVLRREQGRFAELEPVLEGFVEQFPAIPSWRAGLAYLRSEIGRTREAREELERFAAADFSELPRDSNWITGVAILAEVCATVGEARWAPRLYDLLLPYARRNVIVGYAVVCWGSASRYLGLLAGTMSRFEEAAHHFDVAEAMNASMEARPLLARTQLDHVGMLLAQNDPAQRERALDLLHAALRTFEELEMAGCIERARVLQARLEEPPLPGRSFGSSQPEREAATSSVSWRVRNSFARAGEYWAVSYQGTSVRLKNSKGIQYVAHLIAHPRREIHVADLIAATEGRLLEPRHEAYARMSQAELEKHSLHVTSQAVTRPASDAQAKLEYRRRLDSLRDELEEAERFNDLARAARARAEIEFISSELATAYGAGGRPRAPGDPVEKLRKAVSNRIRDALGRIGEHHPSLGDHLVSAIRTGTFCSYNPVDPTDWEL